MFDTATSGLSRRGFLGLAAAAGAAVQTLGGAKTVNAASPRWPGHQPGRVYLGMSTETSFDAALAKTGPVGLQRTFGS